MESAHSLMRQRNVSFFSYQASNVSVPRHHTANTLIAASPAPINFTACRPSATLRPVPSEVEGRPRRELRTRIETPAASAKMPDLESDQRTAITIATSPHAVRAIRVASGDPNHSTNSLRVRPCGLFLTISESQ